MKMKTMRHTAFRLRHLLTSLVIWICLCMCSRSYGQIIAPGFQETLLADNLNPVTLTIDHHSRVWIVEKSGRVLIMGRDGRVKPDPFITLDVDDFNERGLLGIALHPDFDNNPYVYLYYTVPDQDHNRVSRFRANGDLAVPDSEEILLELDGLRGPVHNSGAMVFDKDGYLFIAAGDGSWPNNSQDFNTTLGSILRIHDDGSIPTDNPFYDNLEGNNRAIWAKGLRNPFTMTYDEYSDALYIGDVGLGTYEEVNRIVRGGNYGWPIVEGYIDQQTPPENYKDPIHVYDHNAGCAIVGLNVYRPHQRQLPEEYIGKIFYADYCQGYINVINEMDGSLYQTFATNLDRPLQIIDDMETGEFYYLIRAGIGGGSQQDNTSSNEGSLWKVFFTGSGVPNISQSPTHMVVPVGEDVVFNVRATGSSPLSYQWYLNDTLFGPDTSAITLFDVSLLEDNTIVRCVVSNAEGSDTSDIGVLNVVDNTRPEVSITLSAPQLEFRAGDVIEFKGLVKDAEDGMIDPTKYVWKVDLHHDEHTHPVIEGLTGTDQGSFEVPIDGETSTNIWFRVYLSAQDDDGFVGQSYEEIFPDVSTITIEGDLGVKINIDGRLRPLPWTFESLIGLNRTVLVPEVQFEDNHVFLFDSWEDGLTDNPRIFRAGETPLTTSVSFNTLLPGTGRGLTQSVFSNDVGFDLAGEPDTVVIDSAIDMRGILTGPYPNISPDVFSVRWEGFIEPWRPGPVQLHITSDDGHRLWIDGKLLIDDWVNHGPTQRTVTYDFKDMNEVPIVIEYYEDMGGATLEFAWTYEELPEHLVPYHKLYPVRSNMVTGRIYVDENISGAFDETDEVLDGTMVLVRREEDDVIEYYQFTDEDGVFSFSNIGLKSYYLEVLRDTRFIGLDREGATNKEFESSTFILSEEDTLTVDFTWTPPQNLLVYPQPATNDLYVFSYKNPIEWISIFDIEGAALIREVGSDGSEQLRLDTSNLSAGQYIMEVRTERETYRQSVMIQ